MTCYPVDLHVVDLRQGLDDGFSTALVLNDENAQQLYERLVVPLCLVIGLSMIGQRPVMLELEHCPDVRNKFYNELWAIV